MSGKFEVQTLLNYLSQIEPASWTLDFDDTIQNVIVGITGFSLVYPDDSSHDIQNESIRLSHQTTNGGKSIVITPDVQFNDADGNTFDASSTLLCLTALAYTSSTSTDAVTLETLSNVQTGQTVNVANDGGAVSAGVISGFSFYTGSDARWLLSEQVTAGASVSGGIATLTYNSVYKNESGDDVTTAGDVGLIFIGSDVIDSPVYVYNYIGTQGDGYTATVSFSDLGLQSSDTLSGACVFLNKYFITYADGEDHKVNAVGAGGINVANSSPASPCVVDNQARTITFISSASCNNGGSLFSDSSQSFSQHTLIAW